MMRILPVPQIQKVGSPLDFFLYERFLCVGDLRFTSDNSAENEEMLKKDLPLRYTWRL